MYAWEELHRPRTVADTILPAPIKAKFQSYVDSGNIPNLLLAGPPGVGKTTIARAMLDELQCDSYVLNASLNGNIDTLRNEITQFASSVSFAGGRKYVILDEADYLNAQSTQPSLRAFMQDFKANCGFILTCNWKSRIIEPLHSRLSVIDFIFPPKERDKLLLAQFRRAIKILESENVTFETQVIASLVDQYFPDFRKVLIELQAYYKVTGSIDEGILATARNENIVQLLGYLKKKSFTDVRKWVGENADNTVFRTLYDEAPKVFATSFLPMLVILTAQYQSMAAQSVDDQINITAYLTEVMASAEWI